MSWEEWVLHGVMGVVWCYFPEISGFAGGSGLGSFFGAKCVNKKMCVAFIFCLHGLLYQGEHKY